jgi:hypothetical protein
MAIMTEYHQEDLSLPLSKDEFFPNHSEDPKEITHALRLRMLHLTTDIEQLMRHPSFARNLDFLDMVASHIMTLQSLTSSAYRCSELTQETAGLVHNILTCPVLVQYSHQMVSLLEAAKMYRKNRQHKEPLASLLRAYAKYKVYSQPLVNTLKVLAFDLTEEMGNI